MEAARGDEMLGRVADVGGGSMTGEELPVEQRGKTDDCRGKRDRATRLTERDRDLLGLFVLARYLTATQVRRLAFDGKNLSLAYRRLLRLSGSQPAFLRQRSFRKYDGARVAVWMPTPHALAAASARAPDLPELPKHEVGAQFLEHLVQLNELLLGLWWHGSRCPLATHPSFRWIPSDRVRLVWGQYEMREGRRQQRVIQPDAVLEVPVLRRRYFLECEMGTHVISPGQAKPPGATLSKAERYHAFLTDLTDLNSRQTHYLSQYPDGFAPVVLFLVLSEGRAASVNAALAGWRAQLVGPRRSELRALTFSTAIAELRGLAGLPLLSPRGPKPSDSAAVPPSTAAVTHEEVRLLEQCFYDSVMSIKRARAVFRTLARADLPTYPSSYDSARVILARLSSSLPA
jgi:hypothetical protein